MPSTAYAVVALFAGVAVAAGGLSAWILGPRRPWAVLAPTLAAFGALYLIGHRLSVSIGPEVPMFGFRIALPFDASVAVVVALITGAFQAWVARLLQSQQRGAGRDRLA